MRGVRVAWFTHRGVTHPRAGGVERTVWEISTRLAAKGHEVSVICGGWTGAPLRAVHKGVDVYLLPTPLLLHALGPVFVRFAIKPDVLVDDLGHVLPWFSPWLVRKPGTAFFHHLHRRTLSGQVGRTTAELLTRCESFYPRIYSKWPFTTESEQSRLDLVELGVSPARIATIRPGLDLVTFRPRTKACFPLIVYFGGMRTYKRPEHAIRAFQTILRFHSDARLKVIGDGPALLSLKEESHVLGVEESVDFLGRLTTTQIARVLSEAWVNLHCSVAEGYGFSILEAAASGVPTVAYDVPGISQSVIQGISGLRVKGSDPEHLAYAALSVLHSPEKWTQSCRDAVKEYSWDECASRWEMRLHSLVEAQ